MDDIVHRLRNWVIAVHAPPVSDLLDEAATEIELLRREKQAYMDDYHKQLRVILDDAPGG